MAGSGVAHIVPVRCGPRWLGVPVEEVVEVAAACTLQEDGSPHPWAIGRLRIGADGVTVVEPARAWGAEAGPLKASEFFVVLDTPEPLALRCGAVGIVQPIQCADIRIEPSEQVDEERPPWLWGQVRGATDELWLLSSLRLAAVVRAAGAPE